MTEKDRFGMPGFFCVGIGGISAIFGMLALAAYRAMGEPENTPGLDWKLALWGVPYWMASTLGPVVSWIMFLGGLFAMITFIITHSKERET